MDTGTAVSPDPGEPHDSFAAPTRVGLVPYSTSHELTAPPFGFTVPFNVADVEVTSDAGFVTTVGACWPPAEPPNTNASPCSALSPTLDPSDPPTIVGCTSVPCFSAVTATA